MEEKYSGNKGGEHRLVIENRARMDLTGVVHVESFDDEEVILQTSLGLLAIRGESLHIKQLTLEQGELSVEGLILELVYFEDRGLDRGIKNRGKNIFQKLFR